MHSFSNRSVSASLAHAKETDLLDFDMLPFADSSSCRQLGRFLLQITYVSNSSTVLINFHTYHISTGFGYQGSKPFPIEQGLPSLSKYFNRCWLVAVARMFTLHLKFLFTLTGFVSVLVSAYRDNTRLQAISDSLATKSKNKT